MSSSLQRGVSTRHTPRGAAMVGHQHVARSSRTLRSTMATGRRVERDRQPPPGGPAVSTPHSRRGAAPVANLRGCRVAVHHQGVKAAIRRHRPGATAQQRLAERPFSLRSLSRRPIRRLSGRERPGWVRPGGGECARLGEHNVRWPHHGSTLEPDDLREVDSPRCER
jgi:hypothetical protein